MTILFFKKSVDRKKAFILPLTLLITTIMLAISTGISTILVKQLFFSRLSRESHTAYYAADSGLACAIYIDDAYFNQATGIGIFEYNASGTPPVTPDDVLVSVNDLRTSRSIPNIPTLGDIKCATTPIFTVASSSISVTDYGLTGKTTTFNLNMDLGDGTNRCAQVTVNKTATFRQIISRGFNTCNTGAVNFIERAVINTTENN